MRYVLSACIAVGLTSLAGCQSVEQAGEAEAQTVCAQGGYGPGQPYHDYCVRSLKPTAMQLEQQRRATMISNGAAMIAAGIDPKTPKVTCIQQGAVTRCY